MHNITECVSALRRHEKFNPALCQSSFEASLLNDGVILSQHFNLFSLYSSFFEKHDKSIIVSH